MPFSGLKWPNCPEEIYLSKNHCYYFHLSISPFHGAKFKKNYYSRSRVMRCANSGPKMVHLPETFFFGKRLLISFSSTYWPLLLCKIFKKILTADRVRRMCHFWVQNSTFAQARIFFRKPVNKPCFFHSHLSTWQKSKSDINLWMKYWRLKNTEISLAKSHFWL